MVYPDSISQIKMAWTFPLLGFIFMIQHFYSNCHNLSVWSSPPIRGNIKETGRWRIYDFLQRFTLDLYEEVFSLGVILCGFSSKLCVPFILPAMISLLSQWVAAGEFHDSRLLLWWPCSCLRSNRGTIYEIAGVNSGLSDCPFFRNMNSPCGYLSRAGAGNGSERPQQQSQVEVA